MSLPPHLKEYQSPEEEHSADELIASAIRRAEMVGKMVTERQLVHLVAEAHQCGFGQARRVVRDYGVRHGMSFADPPPNPWMTAFGCLLVLFLPVVLVGLMFGVIMGVPHSGGGYSVNPFWAAAAKYGWSALLTSLLLYDLRGQRLSQAAAVLRQIRWRMIVLNFFVLLLTVSVAYVLVWLLPFLDRSWLYLLPVSGGQAMNLNLLPATIKYFGFFFLILVALNMPAIARSEEMRYRKGTRSWLDAFSRSVRFGLLHCIVGIPIYAGLALTVAGLWFTFQYFRGGVEQSALHHTVYNLVVISVLFLVLLFRL